MSELVIVIFYIMLVLLSIFSICGLVITFKEYCKDIRNGIRSNLKNIDQKKPKLSLNLDK